MEPEFATIVLADHEYLTNISIQKQLVGNEIPYDITSCQMFFLPIPSEDGWIILMWDMLSRKLHVLDPLTRGGGPSDATKDKHELIAWKLHHALFQCLNEYYAGWPTQDGQWATKYPVVAEDNFDTQETGACVLHIARHYDGQKLKIPLTKTAMAGLQQGNTTMEIMANHYAEGTFPTNKRHPHYQDPTRLAHHPMPHII